MTISRKLIIYFNTLYRLGLPNVLYIVWYKFALKFGILRRRFPIVKFQSGDNLFKSFPNGTVSSEINKQLIESAKRLIEGDFRFYGFHTIKLGNPPNWFYDPFNGKTFLDNQKHWTEIPDFNSEDVDIKNIWESARFDWAPILAAAYAQTLDEVYINTLNSWFNNWCVENPVNQGPNWKCGQESSIRLMQLLNACLILRQEQGPSSSLINFVELVLERVYRNIHYAIVQDNNHGTSEASALYIGGLFLEKNGKSSGTWFKSKGKKILVQRVNYLVLPEGSFSQHSVTYHRLFLDTLSFVEIWRKHFDDELFGDLFNTRINSAINWLYQFIDAQSGDAPNLGANDGAFLSSLSSCDYRDFRPSMQIASILYAQKRLFTAGPWDNYARIFKINPNIYPLNFVEKKDIILDYSYAILQNNTSWALMRLPKFKFRPSHNDVHHFDLWVKGKNIFFDSGTYSYNPSGTNKYLDLKNVKYHNTVYFDEKNPMPKISRFLLGSWLKAINVPILNYSDSYTSIESAYKDYSGNTHVRTVKKISNTEWNLIDCIEGNFIEAKIGFNIAGQLIFDGKHYIGVSFKIEFPTSYIKIAESVHSKYYYHLETNFRYELVVNSPGCYTTRIIIS